MAGMFDDLIPVQAAQPAGAAPPFGGMFDDLIPPPAGDNGAAAAGAMHWANQTLGGFGPQVAGVIQGALDVTGLDQHRGGVDRAAPGAQQPQTVADLAAALQPGGPRPSPSIGSFTGGYNNTVDQGNANLDVTAAQHPVASGVGDVAGGLTLASMVPGGAIARGLGIAGKAGTVAAKVGEAFAGGLGYGAISGAGNARGGLGDRIQGSLEGALTGGGAGLALGTPLAVAGGALAARAAARAGRPVASAAVAAADRAGVRVPLAAASDNLAIQQVGAASKSIPYFGTRMVDATKQMVSDFGKSAGRVAADYGGGVAGSPASAGGAAKGALENWIGSLSKTAADIAYNKVDALVDPAITTPLNATAKIATDIVRRRAAATLPGAGAAVNLVKDAVSNPAGLTFAGLKDLRSRVGEMLGNPQLLPRDMSGKELQKIYDGLTTDLGAAAENAGGVAGKKAFNNANFLYAAISKRREELAKVLGTQSPEGVFNTIISKAGSTKSADLATLNKIRKSMPPDAWNGVASATIEQMMGRSPATGEVSLDRFFTDWNKFSPAGKATIFGGRKDLASALDDLAVVAGHTKKAAAAFANPSGTAQVTGLLGVGFAAENPLMWPKIAAGALGFHYLTKALSSPATVRSMTQWAKVYQRWLGRPSQLLGNSLQFSARRFAGEIGQQFGLGSAEVNRIARELQVGSIPSAAANQPDQQHGQQ